MSRGRLLAYPRSIEELEKFRTLVQSGASDLQFAVVLLKGHFDDCRQEFSKLKWSEARILKAPVLVNPRKVITPPTRAKVSTLVLRQMSATLIRAGVRLQPIPDVLSVLGLLKRLVAFVTLRLESLPRELVASVLAFRACGMKYKGERWIIQPL